MPWPWSRSLPASTNPTAVTNAGDGSDRLFVVGREGTIRIVNPGGNVAATPFLDITAAGPVRRAERGLLGLAFHPDYEENGRFFVTYTRRPDGAEHHCRVPGLDTPDPAPIRPASGS